MTVANKKRKRSDADSDSGSDWDEQKENEVGRAAAAAAEAPGSPDAKSPPAAGGGGSPSREDANEENKAMDVEDGEDKKKENGTSSQPRELHRTASIFLRNLAPTITKVEVEAVISRQKLSAPFFSQCINASVYVQMCKRYQGFLRAAIADPQPERRWFRRGWVTFERNVNIKEICWNLNNIRVWFISSFFLFVSVSSRANCVCC